MGLAFLDTLYNQSYFYLHCFNHVETKDYLFCFSLLLHVMQSIMVYISIAPTM